MDTLSHKLHLPAVNIVLVRTSQARLKAVKLPSEIKGIQAGQPRCVDQRITLGGSAMTRTAASLINHSVLRELQKMVYQLRKKSS